MRQLVTPYRSPLVSNSNPSRGSWAETTKMENAQRDPPPIHPGYIIGAEPIKPLAHEAIYRAP